jgi:hypothetical protein
VIIINVQQPDGERNNYKKYVQENDEKIYV